MDEFVRAATSGRRGRADALSAEATGEWARLVRGEGWDGDVSAPGGPNGWAPLLYVTHSVYAPAGLARELLARGADPNVTFSSEYGEMSALYGAAGVVHDPELTRVLLEAGADPDDGESVYHATEAPDPACLRLLIDHGATLEPIHLAHALDDERPEHVRRLLEGGVDATELLPFAVSRRAPIRRPASGRRWPRRCVPRATRTAITWVLPSGSSRPATRSSRGCSSRPTARSRRG